MQILHLYDDASRSAGPWNSPLAFAVSHQSGADAGPHYHRRMREVCILAAGSAEIMVMGRVYRVVQGAAVIVEPGEVHAWRDPTPDFHMVVIHEPYVEDDTTLVFEV